METLKEMDEWVAKNGLEAFHVASAPGGAFAGKTKYTASAWWALRKDQAAAASRAASDELALRAVLAAERGASASRGALIVSIGAALIALAALVVSAAPLFKGGG